MWRGIKVILKWGQSNKKILTAKVDDSEEYSFQSEEEGDDDDEDETYSST